MKYQHVLRSIEFFLEGLDSEPATTTTTTTGGTSRLLSIAKSIAEKGQENAKELVGVFQTLEKSLATMQKHQDTIYMIVSATATFDLDHMITDVETAQPWGYFRDYHEAEKILKTPAWADEIGTNLVIIETLRPGVPPLSVAQDWYLRGADNVYHRVDQPSHLGTCNWGFG